MENEYKQQDETAVQTVYKTFLPFLPFPTPFICIYIFAFTNMAKQRFLFTKREAQEEDRPARKYLIDDISP